MKRLSLLVLILAIPALVSAQKMENSAAQINEAYEGISEVSTTFHAECLVNTHCDECVEELLKHAKEAFSMYLIGGALYLIDADKSFEMHKAAYELKSDELNFNLEYAIELHRKGLYEEAIPVYLRYNKQVKEDFRVHAWLSECYMNTGEQDKAIEHWNAANHHKNHTSIDRALHTIHGRTDQIKLRSKLRDEVAAKNQRSANDLIFLDMNWEFDWWNNNTQEFFLKEDLQLIAEIFGHDNQVYQDLKNYASIKQLSEDFPLLDSIKSVLTESGLILNGNRLPSHGRILSDLIRIGLLYNILDPSDFFTTRGVEVLQLADEEKDAELLNIYAYLEAKVNGSVSEETDKKGWEEYRDERFAISYFLGLAEKNRYDNPDLERALKDFPNSAKLWWVKFNCAIIEGKGYEEVLITLIKEEFKTLGSDEYNYSNNLNAYFYILESGLEE